jgi:hypothetical protein
MRATLERDDVQVVAINDPFINAEYMSYMFKCAGRGVLAAAAGGAVSVCAKPRDEFANGAHAFAPRARAPAQVRHRARPAAGQG